jgi:hypothetical protein
MNMNQIRKNMIKSSVAIALVFVLMMPMTSATLSVKNAVKDIQSVDVKSVSESVRQGGGNSLDQTNIIILSPVNNAIIRGTSVQVHVTFFVDPDRPNPRIPSDVDFVVSTSQSIFAEVDYPANQQSWDYTWTFNSDQIPVGTGSITVTAIYRAPGGSVETEGTASVNVFVAGSYNIIVPGDQPTIQSAINNCPNNGRIFVCHGTYNENDHLTINRPLHLIADSTGVTINAPDWGISITSNNVELNGFILNGLLDLGSDGYTGLTITNNQINNGIWTQHLHGCTFSNNQINGALFGGCHDNGFYSNHIITNGLHFLSSWSNTVAWNTFEQCEGPAIYISHGASFGTEANDNQIHDNTFTNNAEGIRIGGLCNHNHIYNNNFFYNTIQARDWSDEPGFGDYTNYWNQNGGNYWSDYHSRYTNAVPNANGLYWNTGYDVIHSGTVAPDAEPLLTPIYRNIVILQPNGGESYQIGNNIPVQWISNVNVNEGVDFYISSNSGNTWTYTISSEEFTTGFHTLNIPITPTTPDGTTCRILVGVHHGNDHPDSIDVSDHDFTIVGDHTLPVITGNSGNVNVGTGESVMLWATATDNIRVVSIKISIDNGAGIDMTYNTGTHRWEYTYTAPSNDATDHSYQITVYDIGENHVSSPSYSIVVSDNDAPVFNQDQTSAVGGTGDQFTFRAIVTDNIGVQNVLLYYRIVDDSDYTQVTMQRNQNTYSYTISIPSNDDTDYVYYMTAADTAEPANTVSLYSAGSPRRVDMRDNDAPLTQAARYENTLSFSATDNCAGVSYTMYAIATHEGPEHSLDDGSWMIGPYIRYTGPVTFAIGDYRVFYYSVDDAGNSESAHMIAFTVHVQLISPNGGERLYRDGTYSIQWYQLEDTQEAYISISADSGQGWMRQFNNINSVVPHHAGLNTFSWNIDDYFTPGSHYRVRITTFIPGLSEDTSGDFMVAIDPFTPGDDGEVIAVMTPHGGEVFSAGSTYTLTWQTSGKKISDSVQISTSTDGGKSWTVIGATKNTLGENKYTLTIPKDQKTTEKFLIKITSTSNKDVYGISEPVIIK